MTSEANIAAGFRKYVMWWAEGSEEDRIDLYDEIDKAGRTGFPRGPAVAALSKLSSRTLWKTFRPDELQQLSEWAQEAGLKAAAKRFEAAEDDLPFRHPPRIPKKTYDFIMSRDKRQYQECGSTTNPQVDHILPWFEGGSSTNPKNLQVLCSRCNGRKGAQIQPRSAKSRRRRSRAIPAG
jgi:hypothetical protein